MYCVNCGQELLESGSFCTQCGVEQSAYDGEADWSGLEKVGKRGEGKTVAIAILISLLALGLGIVIASAAIDSAVEFTDELAGVSPGYTGGNAGVSPGYPRKIVDLISAIYMGDTGLVSEHINRGTNLNAMNPDGVGVVGLAVKEGHEEIVQVLLNNGADIEFKGTSGATPLHWAVTNPWDYKDANRIMVSLLIKFGADVNSINESGRTPLDRVIDFKQECEQHYVNCERDIERVIELLIQNGGKSASDL